MLYFRLFPFSINSMVFSIQAPLHIYHIGSKQYLMGTSEFMHIVQILMQFFMLNLNTLSGLEFKRMLRCYQFHSCDKNPLFYAA
jgi:hypothetical protein